MDATLYEVLSLNPRPAWARPEDFNLGPGQPASSRLIVEEPTWSLYTIDRSSQSAWFVDLPPTLDLSQSPFIYADQHEHARRALRVPFEALEDLAGALPPPEQIIFLFNIGCSGSPLVTQALKAVPGVWSLSEPDAFTLLVADSFSAVERAAFSPGQAVRLIRAFTRLLFRPATGAGARILVVEFRSQVSFLAGLFYKAVPEAAFVYVYRDALSWAGAFFTMLRSYNVPAVMAGESRLFCWSVLTGGGEPAKVLPFLDPQTDEVPLENVLVPAWSLHMEEYAKNLEAGVPFLALRHDDLAADPEGSLRRLFGHCKLPMAALGPAVAAFKHAAQADMPLTSDTAIEVLSDAQTVKLTGFLARVASPNGPGQRLRDIDSN